MRFFQSIRWRLLLWHGVMLALALTGFGVTAWRLERATRLQRVDQELERRVAAIADLIRRGDGLPGRPPQDPPPSDTPPPPPPPPGPPERNQDLIGGARGGAFYYVAWLPDGREISRSGLAPPDVPRPERAPAPRDSRLRGALREYIHFTTAQETILVGRDIREELAGLRRFAWLLISAGSAVFVLGLAGGWWISTRALRPIADISATAARISSGDLTHRIPIADTSSELDDLAHVLNDTFARLQASFARQTQFTADASHELRTPVSVVLTETQTALARERPAVEYRQSLATCQRTAQRMRYLIDSLLTLARLDSGETAAARTECEVDHIAGDVTDLLRPLAEQYGVTLATDLAPARCNGNAEQISQVVANLVSNAIYYNRAGGSAIVETAPARGAAILVVRDTGQGIAPEDLPHIFERFYRADKARSTAAGRCGLGLAITKAIVEAHGGTLQVASIPGQGSTFTLRLPVVPAGDA